MKTLANNNSNEKLNKARREAEKQAKAEAEAKALQEAAEIAAAEGIEVGSFVKINTDGRTAIVTGIGLVSEGHGVLLYLDDFTNWCQDCREKNGYNIIMSSDEVMPLTEDDYKPKADIKDDYKKGDRVRHNQSGRVATIEGVRVTSEMKVFGEYRKVYRLNFGESVPGPFGTELNGGEFIAEAITLESASAITEKPQPSSWVTDYTYDDFAKLEANPEAIEADPDIMGKRFRLTAKDGSAPLSELQVFIQDYAGNERHALYYIWDEWMQEVRANVRPLDWLREHFCHANGWQPVAA